MTAVPDRVLQWLYSSLKPQYQHVDRAYSDIAQTLQRYSTLSPRTDIHTFDNGSSALLLVLQGTLPVRFRGTEYQFPIAVWVPFGYPRQPPMLFVTPTPDMVVRAGQHVSAEGRVYHPYLANWEKEWERSHIIDGLRILADVFSKEPPVIGRRQQRPQPQPQPQPHSPAQYQQPQFHASRAGSVPSQPPSQPPQAAPRPPPKPPEQGGPAYAIPPRGESLPRQSAASAPARPPKPGQAPFDPRSSAGPSYSAQYSSPLAHDGGRYQSPLPVPVMSPPSYASRQQTPQMPPRISHNPIYDAQQQLQQRHSMSQPPSQPHTSLQQQQWQQQQWQQQPQQQQQWQQQQLQQPAHPPPQNSSQGPGPGFGQAAQGFPGQSNPPQTTGHPTYQQRPQQQAPLKKPVQDLLSSPLDAAPARQTQGPSSAPPVPVNPEKDAILGAISTMLVSEAASIIAQNNAAIPSLQAQNAAMQQARQRMSAELAQLQALDSMLGSNEKILHEAMRDADRMLEGVKSKQLPSVDDVLVAPTIVGQQLYALVSETLAIDDAMFALTRALDSGRVAADVYIKQSRGLAREQFLKKALIRKISRGMGLTGQGI